MLGAEDTVKGKIDLITVLIYQSPPISESHLSTAAHPSKDLVWLVHSQPLPHHSPCPFPKNPPSTDCPFLLLLFLSFPLQSNYIIYIQYFHFLTSHSFLNPFSSSFDLLTTETSLAKVISNLTANANKILFRPFLSWHCSLLLPWNTFFPWCPTTLLFIGLSFWVHPLNADIPLRFLILTSQLTLSKEIVT